MHFKVVAGVKVANCVTLLLCLCNLQSGEVSGQGCSQTGPMWTRYNASYVSGGFDVGVKNTTQCQAICIDHPNCRGIDRDGDNCWLTLTNNTNRVYTNPKTSFTHYELTSRASTLCPTTAIRALTLTRIVTTTSRPSTTVAAKIPGKSPSQNPAPLLSTTKTAIISNRPQPQNPAPQPSTTGTSKISNRPLPHNPAPPITATPTTYRQNDRGIMTTIYSRDTTAGLAISTDSNSSAPVLIWIVVGVIAFTSVSLNVVFICYIVSLKRNGAKEVQQSDDNDEAGHSKSINTSSEAYVDDRNRDRGDAYMELHSSTREEPQLYTDLRQFRDK